MLILSRKVGEKIKIGDDVTITLIEVHKGVEKVRVGIDAPKSVAVHRQEVWDTIQRDKDGK